MLTQGLVLQILTLYQTIRQNVTFWSFSCSFEFSEYKKRSWIHLNILKVLLEKKAVTNF